MRPYKGNFKTSKENSGPIGSRLRRNITPDVSIFKLPVSGFTIIFFDANGNQVVDTAEDGNGLISLLRQALSF